jgi:hypothetical protein
LVLLYDFEFDTKTKKSNHWTKIQRSDVYSVNNEKQIIEDNKIKQDKNSCHYHINKQLLSKKREIPMINHD